MKWLWRIIETAIAYELWPIRNIKCNYHLNHKFIALFNKTITADRFKEKTESIARHRGP